MSTMLLGQRRVVVVDDHPFVRNGIGQLMVEQGWTVAAEAGTGAEARKALKTIAWDLAILDIHLPDVSGFELLTELRAEGIMGPVLMHSMFPAAGVAARVYQLGGNGFINKSCMPSEFIYAVQRVSEGGKYVSPEFAEVMATSLMSGAPVQLHDKLSAKEFQAMRLLARGASTKQIAADLQCQVNTVSSYRARILAKLNVKNNMDIMKYAMTNRLIEM